MFAKKGFIIWSQIFKIVMGAIVLWLVLGIVYPEARSSPQKMVQDLRKEFSGKAEFEPYQDVILPEEVVIDDSMNALMCAFSSVGKGSMEDEWCPNAISEQVEGESSKDRNSCGGMLFGKDKCVECRGTSTIASGKSPSDALEQQDIVCTLSGFELPQDPSTINNYIPNFGDPEYLVYYEKFPEKEKATWQTHSSFWFMAGLVVQGVFAFVPAVGPAVKALRGGTATKEAAEALAKTTRAVDNFDEAGEALVRTKRIAEGGGATAKSIAEVAESVSDASAFLAREQLKNIDEAVEFVFKAYRSQKSSSKTWVKEDIINVARSTKHEAKRKGLDSMQIILRGQLQRAGIGKDIIEGTVVRVTDKMLRATRNTYISKHSLKQTMKEVTEEISNKRATEALELIVKRRNGEALAETLFESGRWDDTAETLQKQFANFEDFGDFTLSKSIQSADKTLAQTWSRDLTGLRKVDSAEASKIIDNLDESAKGIWNTKFAKAVKSDLKSVPELRQAGKLWAKESAKDMGKCLGVAGFLISTATASQFITDGAVAAGVGVGAPTLLIKGTPLKYILNGPYHYFKGCANFLRYTYLPVALGFGILYNLEESKSQVFVPMEPNTIGVAKPQRYEVPPKPYRPTGIDQLYLTMNKDASQSPERFFLASPCKTDLIITKNYCSCQMNDGDFGYYFSDPDGERTWLQPIEALRIPKKVETVWDTFSTQEKKEYLTDENWFYDKKVPKNYSLQGLINRLFPKRKPIEQDSLVLDRTEFLEFLFPDAETFVMMMGHVLFSGSVNHKGLPYGMDERIEFFLELTPLLDLDEARFQRFLQLFSSNFVSYLTSATITVGETSLDDEAKEELAHLVRGLFYFRTRDIESFNLPQTFESLWNYQFYESFWIKPEKAVSDTFEIDWEKMRSARRHNRLNNIFLHEGELDDSESLAYLYSLPDESHVLLKIQLEWSRLQGRRQKNLPLFFRLETNSYSNLQWFRSASSIIYTMQMKRLLNSEYLNALVKDILPRHYIVVDSAAEKVNAVKICNEADVQQKFVPTKSNRFSGSKRVTIPCISVTPSMGKYSSWNGGNNFCYSGRNLALEYATTGATALAVLSSIALIPTSGGTLTALGVAGVELASIGGAYVLESCGAWPRHIPSTSACFDSDGPRSTPSQGQIDGFDGFIG